MCGISIIIDRKNNPVPAFLVKSMNDKVLHRGPDDEGYFSGPYFVFGHRRLSIIDTSTAGHQPMFRDRDCIVYNGMLYNYIELRKELINEGYSFRSQTDTEVILAAYQVWGTAAFQKFNGMWAFAIYDDANQTITFCRDHFGIKPLYYTTAGDMFLAASEIKQFTALPEFTPVLNHPIAFNFLTSGLLNYSGETFFEGVNTVPPGHYMQYDLRSHKLHSFEWYNLPAASKSIQATEKEASEGIKYLFTSSVQMRMRADVKVGGCLSGGVDSSSIVSLIHDRRMANGEFTTFTSCYQNKKYDEQHFSDLVTKQTGFRAVKIYPELQQLVTAGHLDQMLYHQDQPFSSASHYSEFNVFKAAHENGMKVMLDGQGSDEYLCGYPEFFVAFIRELVKRGKLVEALRCIRLKGSHGAGSASIVKNILRSVYGYPLLGFAKNIIGKPAFPWMKTEFYRSSKNDFMEFEGNDIHELSLQQIMHSSIPYQLHSEDRNSMMFSIESRLPFLDHRLVEFVIGLPSSFKINKGYTKFILRTALTELPEAIRWRKDKVGFAAPDKEWVYENHSLVKEELQSAVRDTPFFSNDLLHRFDRFISGQLGYEPIYFRAMTLNRFCRIFNMQTAG